MAGTTNAPFVLSNGDSTMGNGNLSSGGDSHQQSTNFNANDVIVTITICIIILCLGMGFLTRTYCLRSRQHQQTQPSIRSISTSSQHNQSPSNSGKHCCSLDFFNSLFRQCRYRL
jgi:hypothetical protein